MFHTVADGHMAVRNAFFSPDRMNRPLWKSPQGSPHKKEGAHLRKHQFEAEKDKEKDDELLEDVYVVRMRPSLPKAKGVLKYTTSVESMSAPASCSNLRRSESHGGDTSPGHSRGTSPGGSPRQSWPSRSQGFSPGHSRGTSPGGSPRQSWPSRSQGLPPPHFDALWDRPTEVDELDDVTELDSFADARRSLAIATRVLKLSQTHDESNAAGRMQLQLRGSSVAIVFQMTYASTEFSLWKLDAYCLAGVAESFAEFDSCQTKNQSGGNLCQQVEDSCDTMTGSADTVCDKEQSDTEPATGLKDGNRSEDKSSRKGIRWTDSEPSKMNSLAFVMDPPPPEKIFPGRDPTRFEINKCARCENIEAVDVILGDWKFWRPIVGAWDQFAKVFAGEFLHRSEKVAFITNERSGTEVLVYRNEQLRQVRWVLFLCDVMAACAHATSRGVQEIDSCCR